MLIPLGTGHCPFLGWTGSRGRFPLFGEVGDSLAVGSCQTSLVPASGEGFLVSGTTPAWPQSHITENVPVLGTYGAGHPGHKALPLPRRQRLGAPFVAPLSHSAPRQAPEGRSRAARPTAVVSHAGNRQKRTRGAPRPGTLLPESFPGHLQLRASCRRLLFLCTP